MWPEGEHEEHEIVDSGADQVSLGFFHAEPEALLSLQ